MAILIPTQGDPRFILPALQPAFSLSELQTLVGGYIQVLVLPWRTLAGFSGTQDGGPLYMVINERGKLEGLPLNRFASVMAQGVITPGDVIVGPAVICTREEVGEGPPPSPAPGPWDHNGECLHCDGQGVHEPGCPWVKGED